MTRPSALDNSIQQLNFSSFVLESLFFYFFKCMFDISTLFEEQLVKIFSPFFRLSLCSNSSFLLDITPCATGICLERTSLPVSLGVLLIFSPGDCVSILDEHQQKYLGAVNGTPVNSYIIGSMVIWTILVLLIQNQGDSCQFSDVLFDLHFQSLAIFCSDLSLHMLF